MPSVLVISPAPSHPQTAGHRARIFALLSALRANGYQVHFALVRMEPGDDAAMQQAWDGFFSIPYVGRPARLAKRIYDSLARKVGSRRVLPYRLDDWYVDGLAREIAAIRDQVRPDIVLVEYVFLSKAFDCFDAGTLKILDTHDVFGDRHRLFREHGVAPNWFYTSVAEEQRALLRADVVLAIQHAEADYFRRLSSREVLTAGHLLRTPSALDQGTRLPNRMLFVGSKNPINLDALQWFLDRVFPLLRQQAPGLELEIVGDCSESVVPADGLIIMGRVESLEASYQRAQVVVNPLRFGTGLKIKTVEALAFGCPLVTTRAGAAGLETLADDAFLLADTPQDFAAAILKVMNSPELSGSLTRAARKFVATYNHETLKPLLDYLQAQGRGGVTTDSSGECEAAGRHRPEHAPRQPVTNGHGQ